MAFFTLSKLQPMSENISFIFIRLLFGVASHLWPNQTFSTAKVVFCAMKEIPKPTTTTKKRVKWKKNEIAFIIRWAF